MPQRPGKADASVNHSAIVTLTSMVRRVVIVFWITAAIAKGAMADHDTNALDADVILPFVLSESGHFVVNMQVNGTDPFPVVIDTGTSISGIFERGIKAAGLAVDSAQSMRVRGLITTRVRPVIQIQSIALGGTRQSIERLVVLTDPRQNVAAQGVLGMDFLEHYAVVFDEPTKTVRFTRSRRLARADFRGWFVIPLNNGPRSAAHFGLHFGDLKVGAQSIPTLIDTGSPQTIMNWHAFEELSVFEPLRESREGMLALEDASGERVTSMAVTLSRLRMGRHIWGPQRILILSMEPLSVLGAADKPFAIVGADFFSGASFAFDFPGNRMFMKPGARSFRRRR